MSTRANIIIKDDHSTLTFYRHSDGYPEHTGKDLSDFVKNYTLNKYRLDAMQSAGWLVIRGHVEYSDYRNDSHMSWKVGAYEPVDYLSDDAEFIYEIDLSSRKLQTFKTGLNNKRLIETIEF